MKNIETAPKLLRPSEYTENQLIAGILDGRYEAGGHLPSERILSESLGVTRPTLRETLKRLSAEGWVTIKQGKPTRVNNYLKEGGLGLLSSIIRHGNEVYQEMILHFLETRIVLFPGVAAIAVTKKPAELLRFLEGSESLGDDAEAFAFFDWDLQLLMTELTENPVFRMIVNDFTPLCQKLGNYYFDHPTARDSSRSYYKELKLSIKSGGDGTEAVVKRAMEVAMAFWKNSL